MFQNKLHILVGHKDKDLFCLWCERERKLMAWREKEKAKSFIQLLRINFNLGRMCEVYFRTTQHRSKVYYRIGGVKKSL